MVLPDLPKSVYFELKEMMPRFGLTQWQLYILGIWAIQHLAEIELDSLQTAAQKVGVEYAKPEQRTTWKGGLRGKKGANG